MTQELLDKTLDKISWKTIIDYYKKSKVQWKFTTEDGVILYRIPTIKDIQLDLKSALEYVIGQGIASFDYGNWVIFWTPSKQAIDMGLDGAQLECLFVLTGSLVNDIEEISIESKFTESLEEHLKNAINSENYELAARLRDQMTLVKK